MNDATDYAHSILVFIMSTCLILVCKHATFLLFSHLLQSTAKCFPLKNAHRLGNMGTHLNLLCVCPALKRLYSTKKLAQAQKKKKLLPHRVWNAEIHLFVRTKKRKLIRIHPLGPWDIIAKTQ